LRAALVSTTLGFVQVVVVAQSAPIEPFGVVVDDCPLGGATFADARVDALRAVGLSPPSDRATEATQVVGPALVVADDLWVTRRALRGFLKKARRATGVVRLALPPSRLLDLMLPLQDVDAGPGLEHLPQHLQQRLWVSSEGQGATGAVFPCAFVPEGIAVSAGEALTHGAPLVVPYKEILLDVPMPRALMGRSAPATTWPLTSTIAMRVRHWVHILRASHLAPQVFLLDQATASPLSSLARALLHWRPTQEARLAAWKRAFVYRGRNTLVHPTAVVEGSVLGDDVVVGPHAVVLQSVIGAGSRIEQRAHVSQSTLGQRTFVSLNSSMQACCTFADADACANNLQACVVGAGAGLTSFVRALDTVLDEHGRPGGVVRVMDKDRLRPVGELPCGAAFGPGSFVGAGVTIAAGRAIPAGVRVLGAPETLLRRVRAGHPGTFVVANGSLVPWDDPLTGGR
jgi:carbonic anhydrase/acetyltransferase-like protein (isoleucine patch superfamily)